MRDSGTRDQSYWHAGREFLQCFPPLAQILDGPRTGVGQCAGVTVHDVARLAHVDLSGLRVTLAVGPAVLGSILEAGNKTAAFPHLGLINLASFLRRFGATVTIRDCYADRTFNDREKLALSDVPRLAAALSGTPDAGLDRLVRRWAARLEPSRTDVLAFSSYHATDPLTIVLLKRHLVSTGSRIPVVIGGYWQFEENPGWTSEIEVLMNGEGEVPLLLVCDALARHQDVRWIPGVCSRDETGALRAGAATHAMDVRVAPDLDGFDLGLYTQKTYTRWSGRTVPYQFIIGCASNCAYCNAEHKARYKERHPTRVVDDLTRLKERHGVEQFFFLSSAFNTRRAYAEAVLDAMIERGAPWRWCDCARPQAIDAGLLARMRRAGCDWLNWGVDTPSDRLASRYRHGVSLEGVAALLAASSRAGIRNSINVLLGMPHESTADVEEFIRFVDDNRSVIDWVFFFQYNFIPHSAMGATPERFGLKRSTDGQGVDEIDGLTWAERCRDGAESLARVRATLASRHGFT
ncbi:MAG: radical SAM protein [Deltaproteobacteria bacterium]|nr:radical SAM protein [Deltaproteobacteria bacterium]